MPAPRLSRRHFLSTLSLSALGTTSCVRHLSPQSGGAKRVFVESSAVLANPERGFYAQRSSARMERLGNLRAEGITLLLVTFDLRDFRDRALAPEKLQELAGALATARREGFKVIFRAAYGFTGRDYRVDPTDLGLIVGHIRQIGAIIAEHCDIVCGIQAGMLGPWGEWHGSNHGNTPSLEARRAVLFGWLDAVPAPITVHVRRPMFIRDIFAAEPDGFELTPTTAFSGSRLSRVGWHNDSFLVRPNDSGTYVERGWNRARELAWCHQHSRFTPFGGETVHTETPMPVPEMIQEMELLRATYLNIGHHPKVLQLWRDTEHQGETAFHQIARRLGYRFVAERLAYPRAIRRRASGRIRLTLKNTGFASPHLARVVTLALLPMDASTPLHRTELPAVDPRRWLPEVGAITVDTTIIVPASMPAGRCRLALRFADPAESLRDDGRYAIRLAKDEIAFTADGGWNILADDVVVGV